MYRSNQISALDAAVPEQAKRPAGRTALMPALSVGIKKVMLAPPPLPLH